MRAGKGGASRAGLTKDANSPFPLSFLRVAACSFHRSTPRPVHPHSHPTALQARETMDPTDLEAIRAVSLPPSPLLLPSPRSIITLLGMTETTGRTLSDRRSIQRLRSESRRTRSARRRPAFSAGECGEETARVRFEEGDHESDLVRRSEGTT